MVGVEAALVPQAAAVEAAAVAHAALVEQVVVVGVGVGVVATHANYYILSVRTGPAPEQCAVGRRRVLPEPGLCDQQGRLPARRGGLHDLL